jgi:hypothetical protein
MARENPWKRVVYGAMGGAMGGAIVARQSQHSSTHWMPE